ncbi:MAG: hypothetical protein ACRDWE_05555 [Acidimicrobiales bacterium]
MSSVPAGAASTAKVVAPGMIETWDTAQGTWAILPMGYLHTKENRFWQLLFRANGASKWKLETPPGVPSNGGLTGTRIPTDTEDVTIGFQPSTDLQYSPVAETVDNGTHWSPGTLPDGLVDVADAIAMDASGHLFALVDPRLETPFVQTWGHTVGNAGTVSLLTSKRSLTRWTRVTTEAALARSAGTRACGIAAITAVTAVAGAPLLGADCSRDGTVGLFTKSGGTWVAAGPNIPAEASEEMSVLRLSTDATGTTALVEARGGGSAALLALWRAATTSSANWTVSQPVRLHGSVLSVGTGTSGSLTVVTGKGWTAHGLLSIAGPATSWHRTGALPRHTEAVVDGDGGLTALTVSKSDLITWQRSTTGGWDRAQRLYVPIEYGSST